MSSGMQDNPFAPPTTRVVDVPTGERNAQGQILANRSSRFWAAMLDGLLTLAIFGLFAWLSPWNVFKNQDPSWFSFRPIEAIAGFVVYMVPQIYLLATRSQTIGKAIIGLRIVRSDGSPATLGRLVGLRYAPGSVLSIIPAFGQIFALVDVLFIFGKPRRCIHDLIADTIVIKI